MVNTSDSGSRGRGFEPHSGRHVVSLNKTYLTPPPPKKKKKKSTGNTQKAVAPSQHDRNKLITGTLSIKSNQNFDTNSTNGSTNEKTNIQMAERKDENYIPLGINAGGIKSKVY